MTTATNIEGTAKNEVRKRIMAVDDEKDITITLKVGLENNWLFDVYLFNDPVSALRLTYPNIFSCSIDFMI
jgi:hypothetical protein